MEGEKKQFMDEGITGRRWTRKGKEGQQKSLFYVLIITLLCLM